MTLPVGVWYTSRSVFANLRAGEWQLLGTHQKWCIWTKPDQTPLIFEIEKRNGTLAVHISYVRKLAQLIGKPLDDFEPLHD